MRQQDRSGGGWRDGGGEDGGMGEYGTAVRIFGVSRQSAAKSLIPAERRPSRIVRSSLYSHVTLLLSSARFKSFLRLQASSIHPDNHRLLSFCTNIPPSQPSAAPPPKKNVTSSDPLGGSSPVLRSRLL